MTKDELKTLKDGLTPQTERESLFNLLNDFFSGAKEASGDASIEIKDIKPTDEREVLCEKMNDNFTAFFDTPQKELVYITPVMEREKRTDFIKKNMEYLISSLM